ncbi:ATP-binding protein [Psychrobacillus sp. NEAU-3TGS]|uniref:ATP-binding protein n=1 Tax=Psychrobacillus sp. NEAU-3TGS TaxID=2995412 RepID=UPI002497FB3D|nr:ATP-binding protein [Psychrobacillus sp. NEAU-3TGS]MDI2587626.1 ATP-binding protein [Psychrobacillus sp. NEAU-3TGS]
MVNLQVQKKEQSIAIPHYKSFEQQFETAFEVVDDVVLKNYITKLEDMNVIPLNNQMVEKNLAKNVRMFKINEIVYSQDEDATYKLSSVLNAVAVTDSSVFIMVDSDGTSVDFYMGIRSLNESNSTKTSYDTLKNAMNGHFPGIKTENMLKDDIEELLNSNESSSISIVTGVANYKDSDLKDNKSFIQGLEKLALSMQGEVFTGVILANPANAQQLTEVRKQYENIYSMLAPLASTQISYGINDSINEMKTYTVGNSIGETDTLNTSSTKTSGESHTKNTSSATSKNTAGSSAGKVAAGGLAAAGAILGTVVAPGAGTVAGMAIGGAIGGALGGAVAAVTHKTVSDTAGVSTGTTTSEATTTGNSTSKTKTVTDSESDAKGFTRGNSETIQLTSQNKTIQNYLQRIDQQLIRLQECENLGMWECAAYFMSDTPYAADIAAATYKSLMQGENTGVEISNISSWSNTDSDVKEINKYIQNFIHPTFTYENNGINLPIIPTSLVSGKELAIHMSLPRKSVSGFPVIEHVEFAQEVISYEKESNRFVNLGAIFNMGSILKNRVKLDLQSLSMHTLITGSTGSGKSNTIYELLSQLEMQGINFLIIEPAKGEYKHIFGSDSKVTVLGTNSKKNQLLKINPFKFPEDTHVLEHIDRLVEIFNVCWPMYAAMPAILKEAIIHSYGECGWDLDNSINANGENVYYPTFKDLLNSLEVVINHTAYDAETKGNYIGSLVTRVKSLTNGINGQIFCDTELDNKLLFDSNVIVDLSRIGSSETKSLIMGILVMRLNEYRMANAEGLNSPLKHVTVLEEAHNILKRTSTEQSSEGANMAGKSVEMLSNAIAEMRTYGEGFIIVDQSPSMLDLSAIRNTNTKIIMRLPDEADRRLVGKAAGLKDEQVDEIIKLPKGVAAIYQNDWLEPVLCQINHFDKKPKIYEYNDLNLALSDKKTNISILCKYLLQGRIRTVEEVDNVDVKAALEGLVLPTKVNLQVDHYCKIRNMLIN